VSQLPVPAGLVISPLEGEAQEHACAQLMASSDPWKTLGMDHDAALRSVRAPGRERYVAHQDGQFAGFLILNFQGPFPGYIQLLGLAPQFRGQRLGADIIAFAERRVFRDHQNVFLCVSSFNQQARRFYAALGYHQVGELTDFLVAGHSEFLLRKSIGPRMPARR
jgi:ribosomal-protein-alanine N-acetyltransferase